jgi:aryl-alcohol dehydrogenase-like predicted oxidoreductase
MLNDLWLGTAQWGWTITEKQAFGLLDAFYDAGFRQIDCATNYPINKNIADFRKAETFIANWLKYHSVHDLKIMMKVGSLNNLRTPDCNLNPSFLLMSAEYYTQLFHTNLATIMIHWDNRTQLAAISQTFEALAAIVQQGLGVGLSGIQFPELYATANEQFGLNFYIQVKHNILVSDIQKYELLFPNAFFIAYGTNGGGIKLNKQDYAINSVLAVRGGDLHNSNPKIEMLEKHLMVANQQTERPPISDFYQVAMLYVANSTPFKGMIVAPSNLVQWDNTKKFYEILKHYTYNDIFAKI